MNLHLHIKEVNIIVYDDKKLDLILQQLTLIKKSQVMSTEILTELKGKVTSLETSLDNIKGDITTIKEGLPAEGGLTADEVADLRAALDGAVSKADALDKENEAATPPEGEQPA
jgi:hypothetical protein